MPDPDRKTISGSQVAGLWNKGYLTRWQLYQWARGEEIEPPDDNRLKWGRALEPLVLDEVAAQLNLMVERNEGRSYVRHHEHRIGCTIDGAVHSPEKGPGIVQVKCVFSGDQWAESWNKGETPPEHVEIQLQHEMLVNGYTWGIIALWCFADVTLFHRLPSPEIQSELLTEVAAFWREVEIGNEPDAFGSEREWVTIRRVFPPPQNRRMIDAHPELRQLCREYELATLNKGIDTRTADAAKHKLVHFLIKEGVDEAEGDGFRFSASASAKGAIRLKVSTWAPRNPQPDPFGFGGTLG